PPPSGGCRPPRVPASASSSCSNEKRGRSALFHCWSVLMISIQLPDGSRREFPGPVTVGEVAASIGPGLAKAALGGRIGEGKASRVVDTSHRIDHDEKL